MLLGMADEFRADFEASGLDLGTYMAIVCADDGTAWATLPDEELGALAERVRDAAPRLGAWLWSPSSGGMTCRPIGLCAMSPAAAPPSRGPLRRRWCWTDPRARRIRRPATPAVGGAPCARRSRRRLAPHDPGGPSSGLSLGRRRPRLDERRLCARGDRGSSRSTALARRRSSAHVRTQPDDGDARYGLSRMKRQTSAVLSPSWHATLILERPGALEHAWSGGGPARGAAPPAYDPTEPYSDDRGGRCPAGNTRMGPGGEIDLTRPTDGPSAGPSSRSPAPAWPVRTVSGRCGLDLLIEAPADKKPDGADGNLDGIAVSRPLPGGRVRGHAACPGSASSRFGPRATTGSSNRHRASCSGWTTLSASGGALIVSTPGERASSRSRYPGAGRVRGTRWLLRCVTRRCSPRSSATRACRCRAARRDNQLSGPRAPVGRCPGCRLRRSNGTRAAPSPSPIPTRSGARSPVSGPWS